MKAIELLRFLQTLSEEQLVNAHIYYDDTDIGFSYANVDNVKLDEIGDIILS